ncbi:hypothetical protein CVT26_004748 [Gymnopilus dilepis]|uniref:F-box domain-containing protein n=1 Tax=Gymnopilus dilepis TaxID=231916 RepID=A0A409XZA3_9AGAR|nr:hypothetical protein CVT26_004748 [Gymnopilus dilepis]
MQDYSMPISGAIAPLITRLRDLCFNLVYSKSHGPQDEMTISPLHWSDLPTELQLLCISFMTVETLITSYSVSPSWRTLLPVTKIHPICRRLFNLYLTILRHPSPPDRKSRLYLRKNIQQHRFNRRAYLDAFRNQGRNARVPEEFRIWVLEWPEKLVINGIWPGLQPTLCVLDTTATRGSSRRYGENLLAVKPPVISVAGIFEQVFDRCSGQWGKRHVPALYVWRTEWSEVVYTRWDSLEFEYRSPCNSSPNLWDCETWLIFDMTSSYFGKVLELPLSFISNGSAISRHHFQGQPPSAHPDWIDYLEMRWLGVAPCMREPRQPGTVVPGFMANVPLRQVEEKKGYVADIRMLWKPDNSGFKIIRPYAYLQWI